VENAASGNRADRVRAYEGVRDKISTGLVLVVVALIVATIVLPDGGFRWSGWAIRAVLVGVVGLALFGHFAKPRLKDGEALAAYDGAAKTRRRNDLMSVAAVGMGLYVASRVGSPLVTILWWAAPVYWAVHRVGGKALWLNAHDYRYGASDELILAHRATATRVGYWTLAVGAALLGEVVTFAPQWTRDALMVLIWAGFSAPVLTLTWLDRQGDAGM
jgi:hypothetical protein